MGQIIKSALENGDVVNWTINVCNTSSTVTCKNVNVEYTIADGVSITGPTEVGSSIITVPVGFLNTTTKIWSLGDLAPGVCHEFNLELTVDDVDLADEVDSRFINTAVLTSSCIETSNSDNDSTLVIEILDPCTQISLGIGTPPDQEIGGSSDLSIG